MALTPDSGVGQNVDNTITEIDGGQPLTQQQPAVQESYRMDPNTKIPVSRVEGPMWKSRRDTGKKAISHLIQGWEEAEYYYNNTQHNHRKVTGGEQSGTRNIGKNRRDKYSMTENIVYATVNAVVPNTYAKNPSVEITMTKQGEEPFGLMLKHLANRLMEMRGAPGLNMKPKARKSVVRCEITNEAWMLIGWNKHENSAEQARADIARIGKELVEAKDADVIKRLEGELMALEESSDLLDPPGPFVKTILGRYVLVDPDAIEDDFSDANWMMYAEMKSTKYLNARYRQKDEAGNYVSAYKATHVVDATDNSSVDAVQKEIDSFKIFNNTKDNPDDYGYLDRDSYERGKRTLVWTVFDKVKRRFYMFADNDWSWPIWVYDDPYHFPDFFPLERLTYHSDPTAPRTRGEVSNYLDQQDEINTIVDELNRARISLRDGTIFNSRVLSSKDVEDILLNDNKKMKGVKVPEGMKLEDLIMGPPMPNLQYQHLWDKGPARQAVNMLSGVGDAMRGEQFKTNTTNQAIEQYSSISGVRLDEKRDAIEDFIGRIMWKVLYLCLQFMDNQTVSELVAPEILAQARWRNMTPDEIRHTVQCRVEGGSTQKPTSAAKKSEALQIGQILGQFATNPAVVLLILKMFERSFDSFTVSSVDIQMVMQSIMAQMQGPARQKQSPQEEVQEGPASNPQEEQTEQK